MKSEYSPIDRRLREAGQAPVPPPDPAFATMLEDRLRAGALAPEPALRPTPRPARRQWLWFPPMAVAAVAAALALVLGAAVVVQGGAGEREVRVASATDTVVVLPDGTVGPATPGLVIPDGSRLQTGSEGRVEAGDTVLGPKQEAKVRKGTVKSSPTTAPPETPSEPSNPPVTAPAATTFPPVGPPGVPPGKNGPPSTSVTTAPTPTTRSPVVATPSTKPTTRPTDTKPTTTSTSGPTNTVAALKIDARYKGETVKLQWSAYTGKDFAAYLVLRADGPAEPTYPVDEKTTVVARITDPAATSFMETVAGPAGRVYRVVAVDSERRMIAASPAVKPQPTA